MYILFTTGMRRDRSSRHAVCYVPTPQGCSLCEKALQRFGKVIILDSFKAKLETVYN